MPGSTGGRCRAFSVAVTLLFFVCSSQALHAQDFVPPELEAWRRWVLQDQQFRRCPFIASASAADAQSYRCVWPERLTLSVDSGGGAFTQRWQVFSESWVQLPGSVEHWPQDIQIDGRPAIVVARGGAPMLRLAPGNHTTSGRWTWSARPESLPIAPQTAIVELRLDGHLIDQPERPDHAVWFGKRRSPEQPQRMEVQVYRLVQDEVPVRLVTVLRLQASGEAREETLARVLPNEFVPLSLESELPARLEPDGRLRVQVRPGSWEIELTARGSNVAEQLSRPEVNGPWAREEVWSFAGVDRLRVAVAQGAEGIDPVQANVPDEWQSFPAFRMSQGATLSVGERSRGLENVDDNRLHLSRRLWLDFDHSGLTAVDRITGTVRRDWRLDMTLPFRLESARSQDDTLLVTQSPDATKVGVEIRTPQLDLATIGRSIRIRGALPATGWATRFEQVDGELNFPPGHRLLAAPGTDRAPDAWIERWGLWGVFGVLIVAVFAGWLIGWPGGAVALAALLLMYQESPGYIWLWSNLLAAIAVARAAPEGWFRTATRVWRAASFAILGIALLPLIWGQIRLALYPQLEVLSYDASLSTAIAGQAAPEMSTVPAAPPVADGESRFEDRSAKEAEADIDEIVVTGTSRRAGLNYSQVLQRYAPGTLLQAGPGMPAWRYKVYQYFWSGPVESQQSVRFIYIGPVLLGLWRVIGALLLAVLFAVLLTGRDSPPWQWFAARLPASVRGRFGSSVAASMVAGTFGVMLCCMASQAHAAPTPDPALLEELKRRLTRPPECAPTCADILAANVAAVAGRLEISLKIGALASVAVAMPAAHDLWQLETVTIDGKSALAVGRGDDGGLWVPVTTGAHTIRLAGRLASAESIQVAFPVVPRHIEVTAQGWTVNGVNDNRLLAGSLDLVRRRGAGDSAVDLQAASEFPAFVNVRRHFDLGLDWTVNTTVERVAPEMAALSVEVPLVSGESVLSQEMQVRDLPTGGRIALVGLQRGEDSIEWQSGLARGETLFLELPATAARTEVWSFTVNPQWNVEFAGFPAVLPEPVEPAMWVYEFHPRPGEQLKLRVTRPKPAAGGTLAIDSVEHHVAFGKRSSNTRLQLAYRSTQGGRHSIMLPEAARVTAVTFDGRPVQLRPDKGDLPLTLTPGSHSVTVEWTEPRGATWHTTMPQVDLRAPASNVRTVIELPQDRWPLLVGGAGVGPAVLYWGELAVFLLTAWVLGRWGFSPLRVHEWLLLGLGLSTMSWMVFVIVALWLFAMRWRERWTGSPARWRFNLVQVVLALLTVVAVSSLIFSGVRNGLLSTPDMGVTGPGSFRTTFAWFVDRTESTVPQPYVISVPMWVYRAVIFAWALWIVLALLRWLRWAWQAWKTNGFWKGKSALTEVRV